MTKPGSEISNEHAGIKYDLIVQCIQDILK